MNAIVTYVAKKAIADFRTSGIDEDLAKELYSQEYIGELRQMLEANDLDRLKYLALHGEVNAGRLAINMMNRSCWQAGNKPNKEILEFLLDLWNSAGEYLRRHVAMMVLLEDEDIAINMREAFYADLMQNRRNFCNIMLSYTGGADGVLEFCKNRLEDPAYPECKKWTYLCGVTAGNDDLKAHQLLNRYTDSTDDFIKRVAKEMKEICNGDHHSLAGIKL